MKTLSIVEKSCCDTVVISLVHLKKLVLWSRKQVSRYVYLTKTYICAWLGW